MDVLMGRAMVWHLEHLSTKTLYPFCCSAGKLETLILSGPLSCGSVTLLLCAARNNGALRQAMVMARIALCIFSLSLPHEPEIEFEQLVGRTHLGDRIGIVLLIIGGGGRIGG